MHTFAFLFSPIDTRQIRDFWPLARLIPDFFIKSFLKDQGFKIIHLKNFRSPQNKEIQGYFFVSPLLPQPSAEVDQELVLEKIITASYLARDLGADILGLGGYASLIADRKPMLCKHLKNPVTSGNSFTAWSLIEALHRTARSRNLDLKKSTLVVNSATSSVGSLCSRKLAADFGKIILSGNSRENLENLRNDILQLNRTEVVIEPEADKALKESDFLIHAAAEKDSALNISEVKKNAIVLDAGLSCHLAAKNPHRHDIIVIPSGIVKLPHEPHSPINMGLPKDTISAAMAETMILTFEERFNSCSLGETINLDKLELIADLAVRHGFEVFAPDAPVI